MITIDEYQIPNTADELTVEQLDKLNHITRREDLDNIEKYIEKFAYLGVPEAHFDEMTFDVFKEHIRNFETSEVPTEKLKTIEIDGFTYEAPEVIGVKDLGLIEKVWRANVDNFSSEMLAVIFKRTDLTRTEHYASAHLKLKAKLFKQQRAAIAMPYIVEVLTQLSKTAQQVVDEHSEELESSQG
jgi:hypothetical protein